MYHSLEDNSNLHASNLNREVNEKRELEYNKTKAKDDAAMKIYTSRIDKLADESDGKYHRLFCGNYNSDVRKYIKSTYDDRIKNVYIVPTILDCLCMGITYHVKVRFFTEENFRIHAIGCLETYVNKMRSNINTSYLLTWDERGKRLENMKHYDLVFSEFGYTMEKYKPLPSNIVVSVLSDLDDTLVVLEDCDDYDQN